MDDVKAKAASLTLALADPASASGHLVPRAYSNRSGLTPSVTSSRPCFR
jgi:phosphonate transport system substrate-binding protein